MAGNNRRLCHHRLRVHAPADDRDSGEAVLLPLDGAVSDRPAPRGSQRGRGAASLAGTRILQQGAESPCGSKSCGRAPRGHGASHAGGTASASGSRRLHGRSGLCLRLRCGGDGHRCQYRPRTGPHEQLAETDRRCGREGFSRKCGARAPACQGGTPPHLGPDGAGRAHLHGAEPGLRWMPRAARLPGGESGGVTRKAARPQVELVAESRACVFEQGKLWLELSHGPRWKGMWLLPPSHGDGRLLHTEIYPITRYRVTMSVHAEPKQGELLKGFSLTELPPMPSPHRRAVAALIRNGHIG